VLNELADPVNELALIDLLLEVLLGQVGERDQKVHEDGDWDVFPDESEQRLHDLFWLKP
jgi:hypothetical protein